MTPAARTLLAAAALALLGSAGAARAAPTVRAADRALVKQLDREVIALRQTVARLESERDACGATAPMTVYRDLVQVLQGDGALTVARDGARVTVTFPGATIFGDGATLRMEAEPSLDLFAAVIKANPEVRVTVAAHVDGPQRGETAWARAAREGAAVADALVARFDVPAARVTVEAHGDGQPLSVGDTPEGRALNHRVVLIVTNAVRSPS